VTEARKPRPLDVAALIGVGLVSLVLTTTVNRAAGRLLDDVLPRFDWIADAAVPSCLACLLIYLACAPARPFAAPDRNTDWRSIARLSAGWLTIWLLFSVALPSALGHLTAYTHGAANIAAFVVFGVIGEELLFRGAIFELAQRVRPGSEWFPIGLSTVFYSLHHFDLNHFRATPFALLQVGFTLPMGLVFATLRSRSGSLWPGAALHVLTNLPGIFGA